MLGGEEVDRQCRKPEIMADAAYVILTKDSRNFTGNFAVDDEVLRDVGVTDLDQYAVDPSEWGLGREGGGRFRSAGGWDWTLTEVEIQRNRTCVTEMTRRIK